MLQRLLFFCLPVTGRFLTPILCLHFSDLPLCANVVFSSHSPPPQTQSGIMEAVCLCTVKLASPAPQPFALPISCGPTAWSWTRPSSLSSSAAASSPQTSASWDSSSSSSPRSWPHPPAPQRRAVRPLATTAQFSISQCPSPYTPRQVSCHSSTVPSPPLPAAEKSVREHRLC